VAMMRGPMMRVLLEERFHLKVHHQTVEGPVYFLTVARGGSKLHPFIEGSCTPYSTPRPPLQPGQKYCMSNISALTPPSVEIEGATLDQFSKTLLAVIDRPVTNKTGIAGRFDIRLEFAREGTRFASMPLLRDGAPAPASEYVTDAPSIFTAVQDKLGLKLESGKGPVESFVIDQIEKPAEEAGQESASDAPAPGPRQARSTTPSPQKPPTFDVASIKPAKEVTGGGRNEGDGSSTRPRAGGAGALRYPPGRVVSAPGGLTAGKIIQEAFHLTQYQLSGGPSWLDSDRFDLEAKGPNDNRVKGMLQTLLVEKFKLVFHREAKEMPVYHLVIAKGGAKLKEWKEGDLMARFDSDDRPKFIDRGPIQRLVNVLSGAQAIGRPVLDKTGLTGVYVFYVVWDQGDDFIPAMQEQLGLKLESHKDLVNCLVIDRIEKPEGN